MPKQICVRVMRLSPWHSGLHEVIRSHTVKETLPRGRMPIPNRLTVSAAGNPLVHKEPRYDTTALQAREGASNSIDTAGTFVWENP